MAELYELTIAEARALLDKHEITSVELTQACLDRIVSVDNQVRAFLAIDDEGALEQAAQADERRTRNEERSSAQNLLGIPLAIKDVISTAGLTNAFRSGNHADIVRQALIDELGVDAVVDGVHVADAAGPAQVAPPAGAVRPGPEPTTDARQPTGDGRSIEDNAGWGSVSTPAPEWAAQDTRGDVRRAPSTDDSVSEDDEDVELSGDVGRSVIEKVLGGRVISESAD